MIFTKLDLHNPTSSQIEAMERYKIPYSFGMSWLEAKKLIRTAAKLKSLKRRLNK